MLHLFHTTDQPTFGDSVFGGGGGESLSQLLTTVTLHWWAVRLRAPAPAVRHNLELSDLDSEIEDEMADEAIINDVDPIDLPPPAQSESEDEREVRYLNCSICARSSCKHMISLYITTGRGKRNKMVQGWCEKGWDSDPVAGSTTIPAPIHCQGGSTTSKELPSVPPSPPALLPHMFEEAEDTSGQATCRRKTKSSSHLPAPPIHPALISPLTSPLIPFLQGHLLHSPGQQRGGNPDTLLPSRRSILSCLGQQDAGSAGGRNESFLSCCAHPQEGERKGSNQRPGRSTLTVWSEEQDVEGGRLLSSLSALEITPLQRALYHRVHLVLDIKQHYYLAGTLILLA